MQGSMPTESTEDEIALRAAINILEDSVESKRMPSGLPLEPDAEDAHCRAAERRGIGKKPARPCVGWAVK